MKPLPTGTEVLIGFSSNFSQKHTVKSWKIQGKTGFLKINGFDSSEDAIILKEKAIFIDEDVLKYKKSKIDITEQLIGSQVVDSEKKIIIGEFTELLNTPGHDLLVVTAGNEEILIPVVEEMIVKIDKKNKMIEVKLTPGLIDLNSSKGDQS